MKEKPIVVKLDRKQTAPKNVAAKALARPEFQAKVEADPKAYRRRKRHKLDPVIEAEKDED